MILSFELTMPNVGSWNGKWTGSSDPHFIFRKVPKKVGEKLLDGKEQQNYYYNFGDGWGANIEVKVIDAKTKNKLSKINKGFYGYDWMVDSILKNDKIISSNVQ